MRGVVVAVTGGARGIGLATATALASAGARVAIGDLDGDLAAERAAALAGSAMGLPLDVRDEGGFERFLTAVRDRWGPVGALVNNAGVIVTGPFLTTTPAEHRLQLDVNLGGIMRGMRLVLPDMVANGRGRVVNIASAAGRIPAPGTAVYTASKHGVVGLTEAVRGELLGTNVFVSAVLPSVVRTEMAAGLRTTGLPTVPPEKVAKVVLGLLRRRRPPATVIVPRWLAVADLADRLSPQRLSDLVRRLTRVDENTDGAARQGYEQRLKRQLDDGP